MPRLVQRSSDRISLRPAAAAVLALGLVLGSGLVAGCASSADRSQPVEAGAVPSSTAPPTSISTSTSEVSTGPASVIDASVSVTPTTDGSWRAFGLVQNDAATAVAGVQVQATLHRADGTTVVVAGDSPVTAIDGHEQVPFVLTSAGTPAAEISSVSWQAFATGGSTAASGRDLAVSTYWTRPYGDAHRLDLPSYRDPAGGAVPFALYASLTNGGTSPVTQPSLVLAWTGPDGRVIAVATGRAVDSQGVPVASLAPGSSDDVLVLVDDGSIGQGLDELTPQTWSTGR